METQRFRYTWSRTWADKPEDFVAFDGENSIGRVYRINSISAGGWFWTCNGTYKGRSGSMSGQVRERDEACALVEQSWDRIKAAVNKAESAD